MPPTIHLVRHAEGLHNLGHAYWFLVDPPLTDKGKNQCLQLRNEFAFHSKVELVVSSPLFRAIHSAVEGFRPVFKSRPGQKLILLPDLQEIGNFPCDIGSNLESLRSKVEDLGILVDYSHVDESWTSKNGRYQPVIKLIQERARSVRHWLSTRPEKEIVMVSHGAFLHFLTEDWEDSYIEEATGWTNGEYRTFELQKKHDSDPANSASHVDDAAIVETFQSRQRRGKTGSVPTKEAQIELQAEALRIWEQQGYLLNAVNRDTVDGDSEGGFS